MKKLVVGAMVTIGLFTSTQLKAQKGFSVSVKGTPQFSWMNNSDDNADNTFNKKSKFGANFGFGTQYNFTGNMGIGLDILYSLQGRKYEQSGKRYEQKAQYIKLPVFFSYKADLVKKIAFTGQIGPQLSILTSAKIDGGNFSNTDNKDRFQNATFGGMAKAGVQFAFSKNIYLNPSIRYDYDFTNAEDKNYFIGFPAERAKTHNSTLGLEVALKYQL